MRTQNWLAVFLLGALLPAAAAGTRADAPALGGPNPGLAVSIAVPLIDGARSLLVGRGAHFNLVIENISNRPQRVRLDDPEMGWDTLSFEIRNAQGRVQVARRVRVTVWLQYIPHDLWLAPGEMAVDPVSFADQGPTGWTGFPLPAHRGEVARVRMRAIFANEADRSVMGARLWKGRVVSPWRDYIIQ